MRVGLIDSTNGYGNPVILHVTQRPFKGETLRVVDYASGVAAYYEVTDICHPATVQPGADMVDAYLHVKERA